MAAGFLSQSDLTYLSSAVGITGRLVLLTVSEGQSSAKRRNAVPHALLMTCSYVKIEQTSHVFLHVCGVYPV